MSTFFKLIKRIFGPALTLLGLYASVIPEEIQHKYFGPILNSLSSPYAYILIIAIGILATIVVYGDLLTKYKLKTSGGLLNKEFPANFSSWNDINNFSILQASWLWIGLEPQSPDTVLEGTKVAPIIQRFEEDILNGAIKNVSAQGPDWTGTKLSRQQLIDYALKKKERPYFLFYIQNVSLLLKIYKMLKSLGQSKIDLREYLPAHDIELSLYSYCDKNGIAPDIKEIRNTILHWLKSGEYSAIGRKEINGLLFEYELIPQSAWKKLKFDIWGVSGNGISYKDIMLRHKNGPTSIKPALI